LVSMVRCVASVVIAYTPVLPQSIDTDRAARRNGLDGRAREHADE
jgi:hypothetical protein